MNKNDMPVLDNVRLYGTTHLIWLRAGDDYRSALPGQFMMVTCGDSEPGYPDPLLGRAMSIYRLEVSDDHVRLGILYDVVGVGTRWLSKRNPGDVLDVLGPLGNGFKPDPVLRNMLLVGGGIGIAPLIWFSDWLTDRGAAVALIAGARSSHGIFPKELLRPEVEFISVTEDGTLGQKGLVTDPYKQLLPWSDQSFACGPDPMFEALHSVLLDVSPSTELQALLEARMACGFGVCYSCAVFPKRSSGVKLVCTDGPMINSRTLYG